MASIFLFPLLPTAAKYLHVSSSYFFPIHDSVPKAQKSQGQGLANEVFFVYGSFATVVCRVSCVVRAYVPACRYVAHVPYLPAQSYLARYSELNICCRAALN